MAAEHGPPPRDLEWLARLAANPGAFGFHAALRRFEASFPDRPRFGEGEHASDDRVRLGQAPSAKFEPNEIMRYFPGEGDGPAVLTLGFMGLWGPYGPLPSHMTEYAHDRLLHAGDPTLAAFANLFHHRMFALFHRAWAHSHPAAALDRPEADPFAFYVGALFGLALDATRRREGTLDFEKLYYAGQLSPSVRNADGLADILEDRFGLPVRVEEFVGAWLDLPEEARWRLGESADTGSLGRTVVLGQRVWSRTQDFRVVLGPLTADEFERMLPMSDAVERLAAAVRFYVNDEWGWELHLLLDAAAMVPMRLGREGRLGWTSRIGFGRGSGVVLAFDPASRRTRRVARDREHAHDRRGHGDDWTRERARSHERP